MQIGSLDDLSGPYDQIYLSPHLDDAALSCGGLIAGQRKRGERVLVVTICTAAPDPDAEFSPLARAFHRAWQLDPGEVVAARLREERAALDLLGADMLWAGRLDAIYRHPRAYHSRETLFNAPDPADPLFADLRAYFARLRELQPAAQLYAPLGVGLHVDHQITHQVAREVWAEGLAFYEDFPYVAREGALEARLAQLAEPMRASTVAIDGGLGAKIEAVAAYASQLDELFGGREQMAAAVEEYARRAGPAAGAYGERLWRQG